MEKYPQLKEKVRAVIMCGGYGTRMWPMSRRRFPKQFQPLVGQDSFLETTYKRIKLGFSPKDIFFSTSVDQIKFVKSQVKGVPKRNFIAEPERRDNLGAIGYATVYIDHYYPNTLMAITWSDQIIKEEKKYIRALMTAAQICQSREVIVKIDTKPDFLSVGWGWIKFGKKITKLNGYSVYEFLQFVEKPDVKKAKKYFNSPNYAAHTGYSVWRTSVLLECFKKYSPKTFKHLQKIKKAIGTSAEKEVLRKEYHQIEATSIDYGLLEKVPANMILEIPTNFGWHDSGTWQQLYEALAIGDRQNITRGEVKFIDAKGNLVYVPRKKIAAIIGVEGLVVVDTADGLLVCQREQADKVKKFLKNLKEEGRTEFL
jgi:mannose-1-phosphate guanylyltransferase